MKKIYLFLVLACLTTSPLFAQQSALTIDQLLENVEQGKVNDNSENKKREAEFRQKRDQQENLLSEADTTRVTEENRSTQLEAIFEENEAELNVLQDTLTERLGALKELFGVMQQVAGDARTRFENSLTNVQYPDRTPFLEELAKKIGSNSKLPSIDEIERLWFELQREMTETGKVVKFTTDVIDTNGSKQSTEVVRVGAFNIVADGKYLTYSPETGNVTEIPRQPEGRRYTSSTSNVFESGDEKVSFGIDPTLGGVLASLVARPNLMERVQQGGIVGYLVLLLGAFGVGIAIQRLYILIDADKKVTAQLNSDVISTDNALGRVLSVYEKNKTVDTDTLELKMAEAVFKETPELNKGLLIIKVISVVAPLMGLLGTVTGMIKTFQAITLYGTGDPKLMAGGISQALVTTVLGLTVAIPTTLLHTIVSGRSRRVTQIIQEQGAGIIASHSEKSS
ncbi:MAG: MotA/TolQ/ExbB proton channel family protein [Gammaproteobacteria bacterium]|jgi:biopolymer transport protein ExbB|nr:energy transducer TonB [Gammaproteobacteria bacterium]MBQ08292.1 energy transducer TonB [Gammaproteobacteria bacterium]MDP6147316.1 MotA/TolQ/ExbB proton channel family protein [Gammaproteobacteria bacterium]HJL80579.1 MotA/TolQ/ExbB proton channel family protein [Gammaproteobacteria bacterium]HJM09037.1 MotA/TolQ/ExbB proton channel family protein [Gammaproteobacteria bacterium]|tara:strand:+ start:6755 stop:8113 length:1359 start_codon:yes stop_codon:yes gene_type:complete